MSENLRYHGGDQGWMSYNSNDGTGKIASNVPILKRPSNNWNGNNGMGRYSDGVDLLGTYNSISQSPDFCTGYCSSTAVFLRGGHFGATTYSGVYGLNLGIGPSHISSNNGFRCVYLP
jgi:hypothetical protein